MHIQHTDRYVRWALWDLDKHCRSSSDLKTAWWHPHRDQPPILTIHTTSSWAKTFQIHFAMLLVFTLGYYTCDFKLCDSPPILPKQFNKPSGDKALQASLLLVFVYSRWCHLATVQVMQSNMCMGWWLLPCQTYFLLQFWSNYEKFLAKIFNQAPQNILTDFPWHKVGE